jgi:hypothetical protein
MKTVLLLLVVGVLGVGGGCGAANQPLLSHVPAPNPGAVAGIAGLAAAAVTLASPGSVNQKPEDKINENTRPQPVDQNVPPDVFDRLDEQNAASGTPTPATSASATRKNTPAIRVPSPKEAVEQTQPTADQPPN